MADLKAPATTDDTEDDDLASIGSLTAFDEGAYRRLLSEQGVSEGLVESLVAPLKAQAAANQRLVARETSRGLKDYRANILTELNLPDNTPLSGSTKAELRRSAVAQRAFADSIAATLAPKTATTSPAPREGRSGEAEWIQAPGGATQVVSDRPTPSWDEVRMKALGGSKRANDARPTAAGKEAALADIKENFPRQINRPSFGSIMARGAEKQP